ncbi:MAG: isoleucine--tRNA ligase [Methanomassiliicoccaceae archaeon]|jgi:isoleucyl-tRNA synthetase|nr:isoleucine--tRNA ligase [Methanomassiliicoccaceae archaeon]
MIKQVRANYDAPTIEKEIQEFWRSEKAYERTKELRKDCEKFYFLDGPPYTTGSIHLGTAMNKTVKDILIRYWRMKGLNVHDQPGFDMHGLPIEVQVEKKVGLRSKKDIEEYGIDKFIDTCKTFALELHASMTEQFKQLGIWMDWDDPYLTIKSDYLEAAWWTISRANERGLLDSANRVLTWCPRCETALAEAEIEYWDEDDPSIMVRFPIKGEESALLIWTTTPWTLPSNMAVAVHPELEYAKVEFTGSSGKETLVIIGSEIENIKKIGKYDDAKVIKKMKGRELEGIEYVPPFDIDEKYLKRSEWTYKVLLADYVESDNTGLVHTAPGVGPDDYETGKKYGLGPFCPVNEAGRFTEAFPMMAGQKVKTANADLIKYLDEKKVLFNSSKIKHRYGHCWRCKSPIIYRNTDQWFIKVTEIKDKMLSEIERVKWVPEWAGSSRERNWVEGVHDWCISRQRYWGIPIPVWTCTCGEKRVVGSYKQLKEGDGYTEGMDTHRPWIDKVTFKCKKCGGEMKRVKDVLDVWFDSGVAGWATLGYPSNETEFNKWWPADFITEAHDQTRGWFYSQLAAGVISFDRAPYDEVLMHGWVLDPKGQKMSKSKGNIIEPLDIIKDVGADSMRFYVTRVNSPWEDTAFQKDGPKNARKVLNTYWNVVNFASTYMNIDNYDPEDHTFDSIKKYLRNEDLWMISKTERMKREVTENMESRNLHKVGRALEEYILEDLSRWYVRLVRDRTWSENEDAEKDKNASYFILHYAIMNTALALAPLCPHISEEVYRHMGGKKLSVHMEDWPSHDEKLIRDDLEYSMKSVQDIVEIIASERQKNNVKLRWPLKSVIIQGESNDVNASVRIFGHVLAQQGNIKTVDYLDANAKCQCVTDPNVTRVSFGPGNLCIDFELTEDIEAEGYARELIRRIQQMRKDMKLDVEQYINCDVKADAEMTKFFEMWKDHIANEVRAKAIVFTDSPTGKEVKTWDVQGKDIEIGISQTKL